jgi:hypothetical protein
MIANLKSATATSNQCGYRSLWCEVVRQCFYRASIGEASAINFFKQRGGQFSILCGFLELDEAMIREVVINKRRNRNNG